MKKKKIFINVSCSIIYYYRRVWYADGGRSYAGVLILSCAPITRIECCFRFLWLTLSDIDIVARRISTKPDDPTMILRKNRFSFGFLNDRTLLYTLIGCMLLMALISPLQKIISKWLYKLHLWGKNDLCSVLYPNSDRA